MPVSPGVRDFHAALPGYAPTPLMEVPALAAQLGVGRVFVKDESTRMGLAAFKVLGASMAGLNCGTPSLLAWPYLRDGLDAAVAVTDPDGIAAARTLATCGIAAGPCGGGALAGARAALTGQDAETRRAALAVDPGTTVVLLSTEGAAANPLPGAASDLG